MAFLLIDRRKAGRGKSSNNRQKLLRRVRTFIKNSMPSNLGTGVGLGYGTSSQQHSPVKVAGSALEEPWFAYAQGGEHTIILPGNDQYNRGDEIEFPQDESAPQGGPGENGEDDFIINVARDEFLDLFFEDCELPNLKNSKIVEKLENKLSPAGFSTTGNPSQLSVIRSYKQSMARRWAVMDDAEEEKAALLVELRQLEEGAPGTEYLTEEKRVARMAEILLRLKELDAELDFLDNFDKSDLRYKKKDAKPLRTIESVLIMIMDISGSMGQKEKTIARRWFALLYAFIKKKYQNTDLVFIAHTEEAIEMNEDDFFSTRINGGTVVSPAIALANKIIRERYDPHQTNIYVSHASDGDNYTSDTENVVDEMLKAGGLLNKVQMFSYVEVGKGAAQWFSSGNSIDTDSSLWEAYAHCQQSIEKGKLPMAILEEPDECYPVFKKIFRKAK